MFFLHLRRYVLNSHRLFHCIPDGDYFLLFLKLCNCVTCEASTTIIHLSPREQHFNQVVTIHFDQQPMEMGCLDHDVQIHISLCCCSVCCNMGNMKPCNEI